VDRYLLTFQHIWNNRVIPTGYKTIKMKEKKKFDGILGTYTIVETEDQSFTLHSEYFDENCHSESGAVAETLYNYFEGCEVAQQIQNGQNDLKIFEVGFGLGIGAKVTYEQLKSSKAKCTFISTEIDEALVTWTMANDTSVIYNSLEKITDHNLTYYKSTTDNFTLLILIGDARVSTVEAMKLGLVSNVNAIYQDAFSPKKNPALWTNEWFTLLKELSDKDVIMSTYSSAGEVRKSLLNAGWKVFKRLGFKAKRSATIAKFYGEMDENFIANVHRTPNPALEDKQL